jgi:hypothetical protein
MFVAILLLFQKDVIWLDFFCSEMYVLVSGENVFSVVDNDVQRIDNIQAVLCYRSIIVVALRLLVGTTSRIFEVCW